MKKNILCLLFFPLFAWATAAQAQEDFRPLQTGTASFLTLPTDARTAAMAGAGVALSGNNHSIFYNGATALADKNLKGGVTYNFTPWMRNYESGYSLNALGGFYKINPLNALLAGFRYYNYPKFSQVSAGENSTVKIYPCEWAAEAGYARGISSNLSVAATFRYIHSDMGSVEGAKSADAIAFDVGALYKKEIRFLQDACWTFGLQIANIGSKIKYLDTKENIPILARLGGSVYVPFSVCHKLTITSDLGYRMAPSDMSEGNVSVGAEYTLMDHLMFRGGYHYGNKDYADETYATAGLGVKYCNAHVDFSWLFAESDSALKHTFWLSFGYSF